jgi:diaminopimelate epimerase
MSPEMTRPFVKMNGAGNDFVVVNALDRPFAPTTEQVRALGDRDTGEGFDQLIAIEPSETGDAFMRVWNSDGSSVETCGNALRCVGWMLMQASGADRVTIDTLGGPGDARKQAISASPSTWARRGWTGNRSRWPRRWIRAASSCRSGRSTRRCCTRRARSRWAIRTSSSSWTTRPTTPSCAAGSLIEHHPLFPEAVNVGFAHVEARDRIRFRVWERGAGLTKACGTGACAALVATARRGLTDRKATVVMDGGEVVIDWDEATDHVFMTGPVEVERTGGLPF